MPLIYPYNISYLKNISNDMLSLQSFSVSAQIWPDHDGREPVGNLKPRLSKLPDHVKGILKL